MGAVILPLMALYLLLLIWAARRGWRWGIEKKGWTGKMRYLGAAIGFLIVYLPVFWDWLPTVAVHQYYCAKESGFWGYKTLEQWKAENPGGMGKLHQILKPIQRMPYGFMDVLDERFAIEIHRKIPVPLLTTKVDEELLVDRKTGEVLAKSINVSSGVGNIAVGGGYKFWLNQEPCNAYGMSKISTEIQNSRGTK